jgi:integrase
MSADPAAIGQTTRVDAAVAAPRPWVWPLDLARYDRAGALTPAERAALDLLGDEARGWWFRPRRATAERRAAWAALARLLAPLRAARDALDLPHPAQVVSANVAVGILLRECGREGRRFWGWAPATWVRVLGASHDAFEAAYPGSRGGSVRHCAIAIAYLLRCFDALDDLGRYRRFVLAGKVFGRDQVSAALARLDGVLAGWGYPSADAGSAFARVLSGALLAQGSPCLEDLSPAVLAALPAGGSHEDQTLAHRLRRGLAALGLGEPPPGRAGPAMPEQGIDPIWEAWVRRWEATSTLAPLTRRHVRGRLLRLGRWLGGAHPEAADPATWTRGLCAEAVAAIDRMRVGEYAQRHDCLGDRVGRPLSANAKENYLTSLRQFFRDCQDWGWIPARFPPTRVFATPRGVRAVLGPDPRVLADDLWAKLLWAGLNLAEADLAPLHAGGLFYPPAFVRALALTWLFSGLRSDEIVRLRVGCVRWQAAEHAADEGTDAVPPAICLLDVPVHKTGAAFTKPVDAVVGRAIEAWEAVRPDQPRLPDGKTGESVAFLFCYRARPLRTRYLNLRLIPLLCRKAGVPEGDARGRITSHRARATIASQLYNAKEPMTLFELQAWLGHRTPRSTQYYARITPTTLAKAYTDAGYFARNVRTIEVLLDRDAVQGGAAEMGAPWQYFDLGHGYCTYTFFEQCPHRLACARCDFYLPKVSTTAQLVEAKANLQRMRLEIPLTEGERAAVEDGVTAVEALIARLADTPTPAGPTPRELQAAFIPVATLDSPARRMPREKAP